MVIRRLCFGGFFSIVKYSHGTTAKPFSIHLSEILRRILSI